jgi:hypothetical protein
MIAFLSDFQADHAGAQPSRCYATSSQSRRARERNLRGRALSSLKIAEPATGAEEACAQFDTGLIPEKLGAAATTPATA